MGALSTAPRLFTLLLSAGLLAIGASSAGAQTALADGPAEDHGGAAQPRSDRDDSFGTPQAMATASFSQQNPQAKLQRTRSRITQVYGPAFAGGDSPEETATNFITGHAAMFGVEPTDLSAASGLADKRHTQPLVYDPHTGDYKFTLVYFSQYHHSVPVHRADLRLLVRNEPGYPLVLARANLRNVSGLAAPGLAAAAENAALGKAKAKQLIPALENFSKPTRVIWAGVNDMEVQPVVAFSFTGDNRGALNAAEPHDWLLIADARTGKILHSESRILRTDITGTVQAMATQGDAADFCEPEALEPMPYARVNKGTIRSFADEFGNYIMHAADAEVTLESPVEGVYFVVSNAAGAETVLSMNVTPPGPADFVHNALNASELVRAEVNGYIQSNIVRNAILSVNPNYPTIATQVQFPVVVNSSNSFFCPGNAWYNGVSINFCRASSTRANTAFSSVVHHEYGHHLVNTGGSGQGQYGEGMGDVLSLILLDDPRLAVGFFGTCSSFLRNANNGAQYPCTSNDIHFCGRLLSGCVWDARNELLATEPLDYQEILLNLAVNSVLLHQGDDITPEITADWLTLDDDDNNILNGTPHYIEIDTAFGDHSMPAPDLELISFVYPTGLLESIIPGSPTELLVNVVPDNGTPVPGTGNLNYRIGLSGAFTTIPMTEMNPNEYLATLPAVDCPGMIQYFFSADAPVYGTFTDPANAPEEATYTAFAVAGVEATITLEDNFETQLGWHVTNSAGLTTGAWQRGVPAGGGDRGDPPTDADGSGQCYVTGIGDGDTDIDGGTTTLLSPVLDASVGDMVLSYDRWFSTTQGEAPFEDIFTIQVSDNGGSSWATLEFVGPTGPEVDGGWINKEFRLADLAGFELNNQFRVRFIASDLGAASIVEAGVDAVKLFDFACPVGPCEPDFDGDGFVRVPDLIVLLGAWGPNSGHQADLDGDGQVGVPDLVILLGDWGTCS